MAMEKQEKRELVKFSKNDVIREVSDRTGIVQTAVKEIMDGLEDFIYDATSEVNEDTPDYRIRLCEGLYLDIVWKPKRTFEIKFKHIPEDERMRVTPAHRKAKIYETYGFHTKVNPHIDPSNGAIKNKEEE